MTSWRLPIILLALFSLLALATSAAAECAWVLWAHSMTQGQQATWSWLTVKESSAQCRKEMKARGQGFKAWETDGGGIAYVYGAYTIAMFCLPDTFDPRGPKGQ